MRVAYLCADSGVPVFGCKGCSVHVQEVVRALRKRGVEVELFAARRGGECPADLQSVPFHRLPRATAQNLAERERQALAANAALLRSLKRRGRFDLVYERHSIWSFAGLEHARAQGTPAVLEVNAPLIDEQARYRGLEDRDAAEIATDRALCAAGVIAAVSKVLAARIRERVEHAGCVHVLPNGVNPEHFACCRRSARLGNEECFTVGFVGSLKPWHGLSVLAESFARLHRLHPHVRLLVVGDGPERENLVADLTQRLGNAHGALKLSGTVAPDIVPRLLSTMSAAVAPYPDGSDFYFSPLKIYEYMAAALPVVASRVGNVPELVRHEATGLLVRPGDAGELAAALAWLLNSPEQRHRLGEAGRQLVFREHTWGRRVGTILQLAGVSPPSAEGIPQPELCGYPAAAD